MHTTSYNAECTAPMQPYYIIWMMCNEEEYEQSYKADLIAFTLISCAADKAQLLLVHLELRCCLLSCCLHLEQLL